MKAAHHPTVTVTSSKERRKMLRSQSLPHVELRRFKLVKQGSTSSQLSQDSEYKDSGIEGGEVEGELDSLPSSGLIPADFPGEGEDFPSTGSDMQPSAGACTCGEEGQEPVHVKVMITDSGQPVLVKQTPVDQKLRELRTLKQHYYPEGGWGWLVISVAVIVNMIALGAQFGLAVLLLTSPRHLFPGRPGTFTPAQVLLPTSHGPR